jgi:hypothetical protein
VTARLCGFESRPRHQLTRLRGHAGDGCRASNGRLAQLGERLLHAQKVTGSIPVPPTIECERGCGRSSVGRAPASQADGRRFESGRPLQRWAPCPAMNVADRRAGVAQLVERLLAKEKVAGSNPVSRSRNLRRGPGDARPVSFRQQAVVRRHSQVAKAVVCKTTTRRFDSGCRLHSPSSPLSGRALGSPGVVLVRGKGPPPSEHGDSAGVAESGRRMGLKIP